MKYIQYDVHVSIKSRICTFEGTHTHTHIHMSSITSNEIYFFTSNFYRDSRCHDTHVEQNISWAFILHV